MKKSIEQAEKQEPVAWMDGYRNIYSLEEKAAGCPEATIPLVPIANQQKTSGSPIFSELHCICGAEWEWHNHDWELVTTPQPQQAEKQEPVACPYPCGWGNLFSIIIKKGAYLATSTLDDEKPLSEHQRQEMMMMIDYAKTLASWGKNTTPQPQREFVSLTPDEIWEVYKKHDSLQYMAFARAIEQSLKEKNT